MSRCIGREAFTRFLSHISRFESGCWIWRGRTSHKGYGYFVVGETKFPAHRVAYQLWNSAIPDGSCVCHACDNRACVRPDHLFLGSPADNSADMKHKGRSCRGRKQWSAKLSEADVIAIRHGISEGMTQIEAARRYGLDQSTVSLLVTRKTWAYV